MATNLSTFQENLTKEKNKSARFEVELTRLRKENEKFEEIVTDGDKVNAQKNDNKKRHEQSDHMEEEKKPEKCKFYERSGSCKYGERCFKSHPMNICKFFFRMGECPLEQECEDLHRRDDCTHWKNGFCKNVEKCLFFHDSKMKGANRKRRSNSDEYSPREKKFKSFDDDKGGLEVMIKDIIAKQSVGTTMNVPPPPPITQAVHPAVGYQSPWPAQTMFWSNEGVGQPQFVTSAIGQPPAGQPRYVTSQMTFPQGMPGSGLGKVQHKVGQDMMMMMNENQIYNQQTNPGQAGPAMTFHLQNQN